MRLIALVIVFTILPSVALGETIGVDSVFGITPLQVLTPDPLNPEYAGVFNYFFTLQVFFGMVALFMRLVLRIFRM